DRHAREPEDQRQRMGCSLAVAEHANPKTEQHVVERRRAVLAEQVRDRGPVLVRDANRDALVNPEARVNRAGPDEEREERQQRNRDRHRPPRGERGFEPHPERLWREFEPGRHRLRRACRATSTAKPATVIGTKSTNRRTRRYPSAGSPSERSASSTAASNVPT